MSLKIAIISDGFGESTLNLVKALSKKGYIVDCYFIVFDNVEINGLETSSNNKLGKLNILTPHNSVGINFISNYPSTNVYLYRMPKLGINLNTFLKKIYSFIPRLYLKRLAQLINKKGYNFVDLITLLPIYNLFQKYICSPLVLSAHEIFVSHFQDKVLRPVVAQCLISNGDIRVFSMNQKRELLQNTSWSHNIFNIPFGKFETLDSFPSTFIDELNHIEDYVLFVGYITPYKGLNELYNAFLPLKGKGIKLVIAGKGSDPSLRLFSELNNTIVINRRLRNDELITLIRKSKFVVCPYSSASQSGIPQTAYVFNKPIIASSVGAFPDVVIHGQTGFLYKYGDTDALRSYIVKLYEDEKTYSKFVENINKFDDLKPEYSWNSIVDRYISMCHKVISANQTK